MKYAILASGSSGNASLVWTDRHCLVVEAGIPMRKMLAMKSAARCCLKPDAILVSHDHDDHAGYAAEASRYWHCQVICSVETAPRFQKPNETPWEEAPRVFTLGQTFDMPEWGFTIESVPVPHVQGASGFTIRDNEADSRLAILTDLGSVTDEIRAAIAHVHLLAIEANYSVAMMAENPEYHEKLKKRLMAGYGHTSNDQVEALLASQDWPNLHTICLIHLSKKNNLLPLALAAAKRGLDGRGNVRTVCAWNKFPLVMEV